MKAISFRGNQLRKVLSAAITVLFTCSTLAAPWAQANFWEERRKAANGRNGHANGDMMARLPAGLADALPGPQNALSRVVTQVPEEALGAALPPSQKAAARRLPRWLLSLPAALGEIRQVHLASDPSQRPLVLHIQDVHGIDH